MYSVILSHEAQAFFERSSASLQRRLDRCFQQLAVDPRRHPNIKALRGSFAGFLRYRLGDYRIVFRVDEAKLVVQVVTIAHRHEVYD